MYANAIFHDDTKIEKEYDIFDEDKDYIAINMNKGIKKQLNDNDSTITENHSLVNKIKNDYILKNAKKLLNNEEQISLHCSDKIKYIIS